MADFDIVHALSEAQIDQLMQLYAREWWTGDRVRVDVVQMLRGSSVVCGVVDTTTHDLLGFARVLSDGVYKALILDVIVAPGQRGSGLGKVLMEAVLAHPQLSSVRHFELYCRPEMVPFYECWGFTAALGDIQLMRRES